jgi:leader peptidase (prepilin peptidase)/N-methyltransferase
MDPLLVTALPVVAALSGVAAGAGARLVARRLRRGAPVRPPWCELALGAVWALCGWGWTTGRLPGEWSPLLLGLSWLAMAAGSVDLLRHRLPDALTLPAVPSTLLLIVPLGTASVVRASAAAAVLFAAHLAVRMALPAAMGAGDVKLSASVGASLGAVSWPALMAWAVLAAVLTAVLGAALAVLRPAVSGALPAAVPTASTTEGPTEILRPTTASARDPSRPGERPPAARPGRGAAVPHGPAMLMAAWLVVAAAALGAAGATAGVA